MIQLQIVDLLRRRWKLSVSHLNIYVEETKEGNGNGVMKSEGSRFLDGEEEGGVTGNLSSLQTLRREGTSLTKRQMDYFALSTVNINP